MKIIIQAFCVAFLSLIPQQIAAQNIYDDMPHSTVDEDQFAIAVGLRIAMIAAICRFFSDTKHSSKIIETATTIAISHSKFVRELP